MKISDKKITKTERGRELQKQHQQLIKDTRSETIKGRMLSKLRESEEKYRMVFESANDVIFVIDKSGQILDINGKMAELTGYKREEFVGKTIQNVVKMIKGKNIDILRKNFLVRMTGRHISPYEVGLFTKNGELKYFETNAVAIKKDGKIIGDLAVLRDITERKKTEKALAESEAKSRAILNAIPDIIFQFNKDGVFINYAAPKEILYVQPEQFLGKNVHDVLPELAKRIMHFITKALQSRTTQIFEYQLSVKGETRQWESRMVVCGEDSVLAVVRDVTARKQAEEQLKQSEEQYRNIVELAPDGIITVNLKGVITSCNPAFYKMAGYNQDQIVGRHFSKLPTMRHTDIPQYLEIFSALVRRKTPEHFETTWVHRDGSTRTADIYTSLVKKEHKIVGYQAVVRDITERKKAEEALRESEELYRTLVQTSPDAVTVTDLQGNITFVSQRTLELHGFKKADEMLGKNAFVTIAPEDHERALSNLKKTLKNGIIRNVEYTLLRKDGTRFAADLNAALIKDTQGKPKAFIATTRDITERHQVENALRKSEEERRLIFENAKDAIFWADAKTGLITNCNRAAEILLERERWEIVGTHQIKLHPSQKAHHYSDMFKRHIEQDGWVDDEAEVITKSGKIIPVHITASVTTIGGKAIMQGIFRDISERKLAEGALKESEEKYKTLTENINVGIYRNTTGPKGKFIEANPAIVKIFGYKDKEEFLKVDVADLYQNPKDRKRFNESILSRGFVKNEELQLKRKDGSPFIASVSAVAVRDENGAIKYFDGMIEDITGRKQHEQVLEYMAHHDALTSLPNRTLFKDRLEQEIKHAKRKQQKLIIMLLDLDRFKHINDKLGHNVGDELLKCIGDRLINILRKGDTVARMGGDEFMLLLPELARMEDATRIAQKILTTVRKPCTIDGHDISITTSIGIAIFPGDGLDADTLMKNSDIAMYCAKDKGRNDYQRFMPTSSE